MPPVGYKVYYIRSSLKRVNAPETTTSTTLESPYYRVELDASSGAIKSVDDKQLQKELADQNSPYRFGQYLYLSGGDKEPNSLLQYGVVSSEPELQVHPATQGPLIANERTAYG